MTDVKTNRRRITGVGPIVVVALLLAGCAQAPAGLSPSPSTVAQSPAGAKTDSPDPATGTDADAGTATETPDATTPGSASSGEACLVGNWKMDNDQFAKTMLKLTKSHPEAAKVVKEYKASGDRLLWFGENGEYGETDDKFVMTMVGVAGGKTIDVVTTLDSGRLGTYGVVDGFLWVAEMQTLAEDATMTVDDIKVSISTEFGGPTDVELFGYSGQLPNMTQDRDLDGVAIYRCSGNELELEADGGLISLFTRTQ